MLYMLCSHMLAISSYNLWIFTRVKAERSIARVLGFLSPPPPTTHTHTQNVVVVGAQPTAPTVVVTHQPRAPDYLTLTVIGFALCFLFGGIVGMLFMIPALVCSLMVSNWDISTRQDTGKGEVWRPCCAERSVVVKFSKVYTLANSSRSKNA